MFHFQMQVKVTTLSGNLCQTEVRAKWYLKCSVRHEFKLPFNFNPPEYLKSIKCLPDVHFLFLLCAHQISFLRYESCQVEMHWFSSERSHLIIVWFFFFFFAAAATTTTTENIVLKKIATTTTTTITESLYYF